MCDCDEGWSGENCSTPICDEACSMNGLCLVPGIFSWTKGCAGEHYTAPVCQNNCVKGKLTAHHTCTCDPVWLGESCEQANCTAKCKTNGHCEPPNVFFTCNEGCRGCNCEQPVRFEDCSPEFGYCELPGDCNCIQTVI